MLSIGADSEDGARLCGCHPRHDELSQGSHLRPEQLADHDAKLVARLGAAKGRFAANGL